MVREVPGPSRGRSQCAPVGEVPPFGFSECEEPRPFEPRVCHRGQYRPVAFQSTSGRDARGHLTQRPLCDRGVPSAPGESKRLKIPHVRRSGRLVQALVRLHVVPLGKGVAEQYSATRRAATPPKKKGQTCAPACTREEHMHHSHNTHRRSHIGTPHAQHSDACTVFHVSAYAGGAGVFSSAGSCRHPAWLCVAPPLVRSLVDFLPPCASTLRRLTGCRRTPLRWTVSLRGRVPLQSWVRQGSA